MNPQQRIKQEAAEIGFSHAGICAVSPGEQVPMLESWLQQSYQGQMKYMENPKRSSPDQVLPGIRTMIVVCLNYRWPDGADAPQEGMISKYAWAADYHDVMKPMLQKLAGFIQELSPGTVVKSYVDTGPLVEKHWAEKAARIIMTAIKDVVKRSTGGQGDCLTDSAQSSARCGRKCRLTQ